MQARKQHTWVNKVLNTYKSAKGLKDVKGPRIKIVPISNMSQALKHEFGVECGCKTVGECTNEKEIVIYEGRNRYSTFYALVHELCHWYMFVKKDPEAGMHNDRFYELMYEACQIFGIPIDYAIDAEEIVPEEWVKKSMLHRES